MLKKMIISCVFAGLFFSVTASAANTYCVWVYCQYKWGTTIKNANGKSIVRTSEFANGKYYLNNAIFQELAQECGTTGAPVVGNVLYGKNAEATAGLAFMWELNPADQAARALPNGPGIIPNDPKCQAMEK